MLRFRRQAQQRIEHDAQQRTAALLAGAVGQAAIVGQHGADAGENRVGVVAQRLHVRARGLAGDPACPVLLVSGAAIFPSSVTRGLQRHQRPAGAHEVNEGLVELRGACVVARIHFHFDARVAQPREAAAGTCGLGSSIGRDHLANARREDRIDARRRAAVMRCRLERDVQRRAARRLARLLRAPALRRA